MSGNKHRVSRMPGRTRKNRMNELRRVKSEATKKQNFPLISPKTIIPGQLIQLFSQNLKNDFQGLSLKLSNPAEYLKQKQKIQVAKNKATRKYNKPKRGPGSRGKSAPLSMANLLERWESGIF